jgi:hypothetical protein
MENIKGTVEELDKIMENLDFREASGYSEKGSGENFDGNHQPVGDFMICCDSTSDKSTDTWKTGLELYEDDQTIFSSSSSRINHQYQVFAIIGDNSVLNPANVTRGANRMVEGDTVDSLATRAKV